MMSNFKLPALVLLLIVNLIQAQAVISLVTPPGTRHLAMGEVGTGLIDKIHSYYYNPALPGISFGHSDRQLQWEVFYQSLMPVLNIDGFFHINKNSTALVLESKPILGLAMMPVLFWPNIGYIGLHTNYLNFGEIRFTNENGEDAVFNSSEQIIILTLSPAGRNFLRKKEVINYSFDWNYGVNIKYIHSALAPAISASGSEGDGTARSFAFDAGAAVNKELRIPGGRFSMTGGLSLLNMGPAVFYSDPSEKSPIPFRVRLGGSCEGTWGNVSGREKISWPIVSVLFALDLEKEMVHYDERNNPAPFYKAVKEEFKKSLDDIFSTMIRHTGSEITVLDIFSSRIGWMNKKTRKEFLYGFGLKVPSFFKFTVGIGAYIIISRKQNSFRDGQKGFSADFGFTF
jgi:hypothetical protein